VGSWVVDTNVLLVASASDEGSWFKDTHVPTIQRQAVFEWLVHLEGSSDDGVVLDLPPGMIMKEYRNKLQYGDYGLAFVQRMMESGRCEYVELTDDGAGHAVIAHSSGEEVGDRADRKMVAAAMQVRAPIANACDTDWCELRDGGVLDRLDVAVHEVLGEWIESEHQRKKAKKAKK
jgi:hypothetical protein